MSTTRLRLEYVHPWPNHAGLFLARRRGRYAEHGLDVDIISDGVDRGDAAELLARGEYDFASLRLGQLLQHQSDGPRFIAVATFNQSQLGAVITTPDRGIRGFADLEGKTIAIPPANRLIKSLQEAIEAAGADFSKVRIANPGEWEPDIRAVEQGQFDAVVNVKAWEPYQGVTPHDQVVILDFDSLGVVPHHSYYLTVREDLLKRNPELVRAFLSATDYGYREAIADEDAAVAAMQVPLAHIDPKIIRSSLRKIRPSWTNSEGRWGVINLELVTSYTDWLVTGGYAEERIPAETFATNEFLPA